MQSPNPTPTSAQSAQQFVAGVRERVGKIVVGQDVVVERVMIALLTGGHLLLQGLPGLAKTLLVNAVAKAINLDFKRVQFTVDMLPSDIIGSEIIDQKTGDFRIHRGPVFTNLLLADEINRAPAKVQSALLEAMQERQVTIGGKTAIELDPDSKAAAELRAAYAEAKRLSGYANKPLSEVA